jgi:hypothetical protein
VPGTFKPTTLASDQNRIQYKLAILADRSQSLTVPLYVCSLISRYQPPRIQQIPVDFLLLLTVLFNKLSISSQGFDIAAPTTWNDLPIDNRSDNRSS